MQIVQNYLSQKSLKLENISYALKQTDAFHEKLKESLYKLGLGDPDYDIVLFGSIARKECSEHSDIDWTLLVDGMAKGEHDAIYHSIQNQLLLSKFVEPGSSGLFGQMTFSQSLIHNIGGSNDSSHNLTRRTLLLLESTNLELDDQFSNDAYQRVLLGILNEYVANDSGFSSDSAKEDKIPRLLLNDFVRLWRTMCVDFAFKQKDQHNTKWCLRNIKLRMSRKLLYIKGLLIIYSCYKNINLDIKEKEQLVTHLFEQVKLTPIEVLVKYVNLGLLNDKIISQLLIIYDRYLDIISNKSKRSALVKTKMINAYNSKVFLEARALTHEFQIEVNKLFFGSDKRLNQFILAYGVF